MKVLYICTGNIYRSLIAETLTKVFREDIDVESRGIEPGGSVREVVKNVLEHETLWESTTVDPKKVSQKDVNWADKIVAMKEEHRDYLLENLDVSEEKIAVWNIDDVDPEILSDPDRDAKPYIQDTLNEINRKVEEL